MSGVVNVRKKELNKNGFKDFQEWITDPEHVYIGRNMSVYVPGTDKSKWHNPFPVKKHGLTESLRLFEVHIKSTPHLYNHLDELEGKTLGCWCYPEPCHGNILIKIMNEKKESC